MYTLSAQREPIRETKSRIEGYPTKRAACEASPKGTSERQVRTSPSEDERSLHQLPSPTKRPKEVLSKAKHDVPGAKAGGCIIQGCVISSSSVWNTVKRKGLENL